MLHRPPREPERISWASFSLGAVVILLTIPLARGIQNWVADRWGRGAFTIIVIACVVAALIACGFLLARGAAGFSLSRALWLLAVAATYGAWTVHLGRDAPEEAVHFLEYGGLSLLGFRALSHRVRDQGIHVAAALLCALVGTADEIVQWLIPDRYWDFADVALNSSSGALMQIAIWRGLAPSFLARGIGAPALRLIARLGAAELIVLGLCSSNTPPRIAWLSRQVPGLQALGRSDDMMMEYGHRYVDPEIGVFFSRFAPADLEETDARRAEEAARLLDEFRDESRYAEFLRRFSPVTDPFVHEARVHLFRRDRFIARAAEPSADRAFRRFHCSVAWRENRILEKYFPLTLRASSYVLSGEQVSNLLAHLDPEMRYVSRVSDTLVCRLREWQIWAAILLSIAGLRWMVRRTRHERPLRVTSAGSSAEAG